MSGPQGAPEHDGRESLLGAKYRHNQGWARLALGTPRITEERIAELLRECEARNIDLKRMSIKIENVDKSGFSLHAKSATNDNI